MGFGKRTGIRIALASAAIAIGVALLPVGAQAGGFWVWEAGSAANVGNATAAWGAGADDATTAFTNPAAMTLLDESEIVGQFTPSLYRYRVDRDSATTVSGGSGQGNTFSPLLGTYGVYKADEKLRFGASLAGLAGGSLDYGNDWSGRYVVTKVAFSTLGFTPSVAYQATDWLSVGGGPILGYMTYDQEARVNNLLPSQGDGRLQLKDSSWAIGGVFGVLLQPLEDTRVAVTYRTPLKFNLNDRDIFHNIQPPLSGLLNLTGIANAKVGLDLKIPQQVLVGISQKITDDLTVVLNADWEQWSEFGAFALTLANPLQTQASTDLKSDNTWHVGVGLRWRVRPAWLVTTGFGYDSSMFSDKHRSPLMPVDRQIRVGAGVQYDLSPKLALGFSYEYMNGGQASFTSGGGGPLTGTISGKYDPNEIHFFTVSVSWKP